MEVDDSGDLSLIAARVKRARGREREREREREGEGQGRETDDALNPVPDYELKCDCHQADRVRCGGVLDKAVKT